MVAPSAAVTSSTIAASLAAPPSARSSGGSAASRWAIRRRIAAPRAAWSAASPSGPAPCPTASHRPPACWTSASAAGTGAPGEATGGADAVIEITGGAGAASSGVGVRAASSTAPTPAATRAAPITTPHQGRRSRSPAAGASAEATAGVTAGASATRRGMLVSVLRTGAGARSTASRGVSQRRHTSAGARPVRSWASCASSITTLRGAAHVGQRPSTCTDTITVRGSSASTSCSGAPRSRTAITSASSVRSAASVAAAAAASTRASRRSISSEPSTPSSRRDHRNPGSNDEITTRVRSPSTCLVAPPASSGWISCSRTARTIGGTTAPSRARIGARYAGSSSSVAWVWQRGHGTSGGTRADSAAASSSQSNRCRNPCPHWPHRYGARNEASVAAPANPRITASCAMNASEQRARYTRGGSGRTPSVRWRSSHSRTPYELIRSRPARSSTTVPARSAARSAPRNRSSRRGPKATTRGMSSSRRSRDGPVVSGTLAVPITTSSPLRCPVLTTLGGS